MSTNNPNLRNQSAKSPASSSSRVGNRWGIRRNVRSDGHRRRICYTDRWHPKVMVPRWEPLPVAARIFSCPEIENLLSRSKKLRFIRYIKPETYCVLWGFLTRAKIAVQTVFLEWLKVPNNGCICVNIRDRSSHCCRVPIHPRGLVNNITDRKRTLILDNKLCFKSLFRVQGSRWSNCNLRTIRIHQSCRPKQGGHRTPYRNNLLQKFPDASSPGVQNWSPR